jgi:hypothetical protein
MAKCSAEFYPETLQKTAHALSSVLQETEVIQILLEQVVSAVSGQKALVFLLSGGRRSTAVVRRAGVDPNQRRYDRVLPSSGRAGHPGPLALSSIAGFIQYADRRGRILGIAG